MTDCKRLNMFSVLWLIITLCCDKHKLLKQGRAPSTQCAFLSVCLYLYSSHHCSSKSWVIIAAQDNGIHQHKPAKPKLRLKKKWICCVCNGIIILPFKCDDSNLPHEAGHEKTKNKSGLNPAFKRDCLCGKTYKAVRQGKYTKYENICSSCRYLV